MSVRNGFTGAQPDNGRRPLAVRGVQIATGLSAVLLFLIVVGMVVSGGVRRADFIVPYTGGFIYQQGNASKLYDPHEQMQVQEHLLKRKGLLVDPYPPFHALIFAPLARLGYRDAYITWGAINVLLWLFFLYLLRRDPAFSQQPIRDLALCTLFFPLWLAILQGQSSLLVLLSYTLTYVYLKRKQEYTAGLFLGLGLLKFQAVVCFALILLLRRRWRFVLGFASAACLLGGLSVIAVGPAGVVSYLNLMLNIMKHPANPAFGAIMPWDMPTVRGFVTEVFRGSIPYRWISMLAGSLSVGLILLAAWRWKAEGQRQSAQAFDLMFASALTVSLISTPYLYLHDLAPMVLAVVLVVNSAQWAHKSRERLILSASVGALYVGPFGLLLLRQQAAFVLGPVLVIFALGALALAQKTTWPAPVAHKPELQSYLQPSGGCSGTQLGTDSKPSHGLDTVSRQMRLAEKMPKHALRLGKEEVQ